MGKIERVKKGIFQRELQGTSWSDLQEELDQLESDLQDGQDQINQQFDMAQERGG